MLYPYHFLFFFILLTQELLCSNLNDLDANKQNIFGDTPLIDYILIQDIKGDFSKQIRQIIQDKKTNLNIQDNARDTAMMIAVQRGKFEIVKELVDAGADFLTLTNADNNTALEIAHNICPYYIYCHNNNERENQKFILDIFYNQIKLIDIYKKKFIFDRLSTYDYYAEIMPKMKGYPKKQIIPFSVLANFLWGIDILTKDSPEELHENSIGSQIINKWSAILKILIDEDEDEDENTSFTKKSLITKRYFLKALLSSLWVVLFIDNPDEHTKKIKEKIKFPKESEVFFQQQLSGKHKKLKHTFKRIEKLENILRLPLMDTVNASKI